MHNCCGFNTKNFREQFDFNLSNTKEGITIAVTPKDKTKVESLQKFAEACQDFCGPDCC
jgi:hypothetical protein